MDNTSKATLFSADRHNSSFFEIATRTLRNFGPYGFYPRNVAALALGFNGEYLEPGTHSYLLGSGYRTYNPVLMRFNSPDSFSPFGPGGLNAYGYCAGDPINLLDPTGHIIFGKFFRNLFRRGNKTSKKLPRVTSAPAITTPAPGISSSSRRASQSSSQMSADMQEAWRINFELEVFVEQRKTLLREYPMSVRDQALLAGKPLPPYQAETKAFGRIGDSSANQSMKAVGETPAGVHNSHMALVQRLPNTAVTNYFDVITAADKQIIFPSDYFSGHIKKFYKNPEDFRRHANMLRGKK